MVLFRERATGQLVYVVGDGDVLVEGDALVEAYRLPE